MEAVPRLPMLNFELKTSTEAVTFGPKLKDYIAGFYNEDPNSYTAEIQSLEALRAAAVRPSVDINGCQTLKKYYCQLHFLKSRFPMQDNQVCSLFFAWKDHYSKGNVSLPDIDYEITSILFNIGALHSQLGTQDSRVNPEAMKMACTHFQCAAWAFQTAKESFLHMVTALLPSEVIQFMYLTSLAQAQECILEKSMMDNRKATIIAKVAVQVVDYYKQALSTLKGIVDDGCYAEVIHGGPCKEWQKYLNFKIAYHKCIALLYQGQQAEEQQKMGERVAFYQAASDQLSEACKLASKLGNHQLQEINEALAFTGDVVEGKKKAAKNENEFIYHEEVPDKDVLQEVKGASLVKGIGFGINDLEVSGPDIFARLVPLAAHELASMYSEEKAKILRQLGEVVELKDQSLSEFMSSLQLDVLTQMRQSSGLTQDLVDRAAAMSAKPTAIQDLVEAMAKLSNTYHDVEAMLAEIDGLLKEEEKKEQEYQVEMGKRPPSILSTDLTRESIKYKEAHSKASDSNENLHRAMSTHIANLKILALPLTQLKQQIPSIEFPNSEIDEDIIRELEKIVAKVEEMRSQRAMLWAQMRDGMKDDDITGLVVTRQPDKSVTQLFREEIRKHRKQAYLIEQNLLAQDNILEAVVDTYARFANTRRYLQDIISKRAATLSALITSYDTYDDLLAKANKGIEFYNKLETNVTKLLQRIRSTCKVQDEEREQMLAKHNKPKPLAVSSAPKLKDYLLDKGATRKTDSAETWPNAIQPPAAGTIPEQAGIQPVPNVPQQIWSTPVAGLDMTGNVVGTYTVEKDLYSNYAYPASSAGQVYYNPTSYTTGGTSLPNTTTTTYSSGYNNYMYAQPQYHGGTTDQELCDIMAALNTQAAGAEVPQHNVNSSQAYGYSGNYSAPQTLPVQNMYYPMESYAPQDATNSQYANVVTTVSNIPANQAPAVYTSDSYSYQMGGYAATSVPQVTNAYVYPSNPQVNGGNVYPSSTIQGASYGYGQVGIQSPNSYVQANGNMFMQTVPASYNYTQAVTGIGNSSNVAASDSYNYGQSNTQAIQSPYSYTQANNDSQTQSILSSNNAYAPSSTVQQSTDYYDPNQTNIQSLDYYGANQTNNMQVYAGYNNYMGQYVNNQQSYYVDPSAQVNYVTPGNAFHPSNTTITEQKEKSNVDLLSGLDFTVVNQPALIPQQSKPEVSVKGTSQTTPKPITNQPVVNTKQV